MFSSPKPPPPPPLTAEFQSMLEPSLPGAPPHQKGWKLLRSSDGKTHLDQGERSIITDPSKGQAIHLDHVKKEALVLPFAAPSAPKPDLPKMGAHAPQAPQAPLNVKDLGKRTIAGHEVEGKQYTFAPPKPPQMPHMPGMPAPPQAPQPPGTPQAPQVHKPQIMEVWTSPKLQLPLASRLHGDIGKHTTLCKQITPGEPPPSAFQIPHGYKLIHPPHAPPASA